MDPAKIPDYKVYKVEDAPRLVEVQKRLAAKGLKDPWIRNHVWRFTPANIGTTGQYFNKLRLPFACAVVFVSVLAVVEKKFDIWKYEEEPGHGH